MRFASHVLLLQLATVSAVVAVCTGVSVWLGVQQLRAEAESTALAIARTVAEDPEVRAAVARYSDGSGAPAAAALARGPLQPLAERVRERTGALFVVLTDDHGIRLAHPDPARLGREVSTDYRDAVAGKEVVSWETGTLGESARAKAPVYGPGGVSPVGEVSVGFASVSAFEQLPQLLIAVGAAALAALAIGAAASVLLRRRLARLTLGVQPEELTALVQDRAAVLDGVGEGVLAADSAGRVTVCNGRAAELLGVEGALGAPVASLGLPAELAARLADQRTGSTEIVHQSRVLYVDVRRVERADRDLGAVVVVRDRTDLVSLTRRLDAVATMTNALRAQRHEFANRLHIVSGLLDADRCDEARVYLGEVVARGPLKFPVQHADRLQEPYLQALLGAKGEEAAERGVLLSLGAETLVRGTVCEPEDVATVLGNLIDNAVRAAVEGEEPRWVEVDALDDGDTLYVTVSDSGDGMRDPLAAFGPAASATTGLAVDSVHGSGFGLPLSRALARRRGGEVWVIDPGGSGSGAVLCARLPGTVEEGTG
ncbi:two-component system sensor protein [Leifsonia xyli subsp. cynodontis DSM 46306]|uniref:Sensor-like histidine kinase SenX3 n=1 Tax=Leifsonia xyli subsp. cynodontis DSM 46306 TaxID=1389489 RepID=U3P4Z0_LEIXC|nr:sensor histidine kinase [Leifsonia xyli]AGW40841.1 two-component system sensor protein [Leifsonia xyli subsp. cynodontis DSM 46306]